MLIDVILIIVLAVLVGVYVSWRAGRLDRLHARVDTARAALDAALSPLLHAYLRRLADEARSRALPEPQIMQAAAHQVFLARKFYNDAVAATRAARRRWLVRVFGLAGGAALPEFFEIDDSLAAAGEQGRGTDMHHLTG